MKSIEDNFRDWENDAFGYGYGTGERHILTALHRFLSLCPPEAAYDGKVLEDELTPTVAWLLINRLAGMDIIEYGISPRYGWLTMMGKRLKEFCADRTVDDLVALTRAPEGYEHCYHDACNCGPDGWEPDRKCVNPFWRFWR